MGPLEGTPLGLLLGTSLGDPLGLPLGEPDGPAEGLTLGVLLGDELGLGVESVGLERKDWYLVSQVATCLSVVKRFLLV